MLRAARDVSESPESLRDVRRKEGGRWVFNPELMTDYFAALDECVGK